MFKYILMEIQTDKASQGLCQRQSHSVLRSKNKQSDITQQLVNTIQRDSKKGRRKREGGREEEGVARKQAQKG